MVKPLAPRPSLQMRDKSRATPWSSPSRLATNARYISRYAMVSPLATNARYISRYAMVAPLAPRPSHLAPRYKCEIHLALRHGRAPRASPLSPRASPLSPRASLQMRDTSCATPWSRPSRLAPRYKCEINLALRHGQAPRASPLATNARYISRYAMVKPLAPLASRLSRLNPMHESIPILDFGSQTAQLIVCRCNGIIET
jgi:hypothetical protein